MKCPGDRVVAIKSVSDKHAFIYGLGTYEGDFPVADEVTGCFAKITREAGLTNPRIKLDSGKTIWGCECWWYFETEFALYVRIGYRITTADINEDRERAKEQL